MTLHYHGTPITPRSVLDSLAGRCFVVSFARDDNIKHVHQIGQSVMLDNGAFSAWTNGHVPDWSAYYRWAEPWLDYHTTWAVIPDVIDGDEAANDQLVELWPHGARGAPVWHMHETIDRLVRLCERWPRVCIGSSGDYRVVGNRHWHNRMTEAMNRLCGDPRPSEARPPPVWLHMLRGMAQAGSIFPFASVDSTDIARNHNRGVAADKMATQWDAQQCPARWHVRPTLRPLIEVVPRLDNQVLDL